MTCIGLFGTCGNSKWREPFIQKYQELNIDYFNPQVEDGTWHPGMVVDENRHLAEDDIILFPVTHETTGQGSLAEIGFSIVNALRMNRQRFFIFLIDDKCTDPKATEAQIRESNNARALVKSKLEIEAKNCYNVFLVGTPDEMLELSINLHPLCEQYQNIKKLA